MSDELSELYQEVILDHNRNPRNVGTLEHPDRSAEGFNPLCGDKLTLQIKLDGDRIAEVRFVGTGCAISQASTSVMTTAVKGKTEAEVQDIFARFQRVVTGQARADDLDALGELAAMSGVSEFPSRVKCATLGWHTLTAAWHQQDTPVSTE